jgi:O-antigen ligase
MVVNLKNSSGILTALVYLTYTGLFFPINISNLITVVLIVYCLITISPKEILDALKNNSLSVLLISIFTLQVVGLSYTSNFKTGLFMLEKKIILLIIPVLLLPMLQKYITDYHTLFRRIGLIAIISSLLLLVVACYRKFYLGYPQAFYFESYRNFEGFTPIHYVYYSLYFSCGALMLINSMINTSKSLRRTLLICITFIYSLGIITLVASKTGIIAFIIASIVMLYFKTKSKKVFVMVSTVALLASCLFLYFNNTTRSRFEGLTKNLSVLNSEVPPRDTDINDLNMRLLFWKISINHSVADNNLFLGVGTGDAQDYIDSLYLLPQYLLYGYVGWDSHNQWVFTFIQLGLFGVALLGFIYIKAIKEAIQTANVDFICFLVITAAFSLTESILEQNKGIVFFALFLTLFTSQKHQPKLN